MSRAAGGNRPDQKEKSRRAEPNFLLDRPTGQLGRDAFGQVVVAVIFVGFHFAQGIGGGQQPIAVVIGKGGDLVLGVFDGQNMGKKRGQQLSPFLLPDAGYSSPDSRDHRVSPSWQANRTSLIGPY